MNQGIAIPGDGLAGKVSRAGQSLRAPGRRRLARGGRLRCMDVTGVILAGGKSTRFGRDKAAEVVAGASMLQWVMWAAERVCREVVVVRAKGQVLPAIESSVAIRVVEDEYDGLGPLAGLVGAFEAVGEGWCFAGACDAPLLRPAVVGLLAERVADADIVCPVVEGRFQPLCALYRVEACLPLFRAAVERRELRITAAFEGLRVARVREDEVRAADPDLESFRNANWPAEASAIEAVLRARAM